MEEQKEEEQFKRVSELVATASSCAQKIPNFGEFDFFNLFPDFQSEAEDGSARSLHIVQTILDYYIPSNIAILKDNPSIQNKQSFDVIENLFDTVFEKLDEAIDMKKGLLADTEDRGKKQKTVERGTAETENALKYQFSMKKPQLSFPDKVDNTEAPFQPRLKTKLNAQVEWNPTETNEEGLYENPYIYEISNITYPDWERVPPETITKPREEAETPLIEIDTKEKLVELVATLKKEKSFAMDLEHHNKHSYQGFTCLLQLSTRTTDYIVDVLTLRAHMGLLNEATTDPAIMKVLHGANMDIVWLQKDFGVYVVNMFDTGQAARVLGFESFGLAYLLKRFCGVIADKQYQRADWRIRPLPAIMKKYAREDTHFLLYISDELRTLLVQQSNERNLLEDVLALSAGICKQSYQKPVVTVETAANVIAKGSLAFSAPQRRVFMLLYLWRDFVARASDEGPPSVLSDRALSSLARALPTSVAEMTAVFNSMPVVVKEHAEEVLALVREGKAMEKEEDEAMRRAVLRAMNREVEEKEEMEVVTEEAKEEVKEVRGDLDEMVEEGARELKQAEKAMEKKEKKKQAEQRACQLALKRVGAAQASGATKQKEVEAELDLDELLHDLAMINGIMEGDEEEESSEEEVKKEEPKKEEEEIKSIRQTYRAKEEETPSVKRSAVDDLLGAREVDMSSAEKMKKDIGWKSKKPKKEMESLPALAPEQMDAMIQRLGAGDYMMDEETAQKTEEMLKGGEKKKETEKKKKKRFRKGRQAEGK